VSVQARRQTGSLGRQMQRDKHIHRQAISSMCVSDQADKIRTKKSRCRTKNQAVRKCKR